ncbi:MAG: hypothetical protein JSS53_00230 [Proteobacteria bacterium]|nr:hypothetical protein [Pseudomonadota bacterium]
MAGSALLAGNQSALFKKIPELSALVASAWRLLGANQDRAFGLCVCEIIAFAKNSLRSGHIIEAQEAAEAYISFRTYLDANFPHKMARILGSKGIVNSLEIIKHVNTTPELLAAEARKLHELHPETHDIQPPHVDKVVAPSA